MLVLRRRAGESLLIGDEIEIELLAVTAHGAKIGIRAPKDTVVLRKELRITQQQNARAALGPIARRFRGRDQKNCASELKKQLLSPISNLRTERGV